MSGARAQGRIVRLAAQDRARVAFSFDGAALTALDGDTVLTAILALRPALRASDVGGGPRAGFCLMGACQDCWIWQEDGARLRACSTPIREGMRLLSDAPKGWP